MSDAIEPPALKLSAPDPYAMTASKATGRANTAPTTLFPECYMGKSCEVRTRTLASNRSIRQGAELPGVLAIVTGADLPEVASKTEQVGEGAVNTRYLSMNICRDKVLYDGHAVAAVAASDRHIAEEALRLIEVDYEVLPP